MARSFSPVSMEGSGAGGPYYHQPSESYFTMTVRDGHTFQRRYQLDSRGKEVNVMEKPADYVMGSGNHARTYLSRTSANTLVELPLGRYAEKGGSWAMNPGYDRPDHEGFRRPITYDCMFCHNAYPKIPAGHEKPLAEAVYDGPLPDGIDCQRCHGDGKRHMQLAGSGKGQGPEIRGAIVNPARLSSERQLEGCMVCHLETTSFPLPNALQRFERKAFSYEPGEPLADFFLNFDHAPEAGRADKFEIVNAAYRLRKSACFLKSEGKLVCTTCHNPHDIPRGEEAQRQYTAVCLQCHADGLSGLVKAGRHTASDSCVMCHMPKRRTEDVIHVAATDHLIQRRIPEGDLLAERTERRDDYKGRVALYYPQTLPKNAENELTVAVAQVIQQSNLKAGIVELSAAIEKYRPQQGEYYLQLAEALQNDGQLEKALPVYREVVRRDATRGPVVQKYGTALRRAGHASEAVEVLRKAAAMTPEVALVWHELGLTYRDLGKKADAAAALQKAIALDEDMPEAHNNLGIIEFAEAGRAEKEFREAIRIRPDYADAHGNLANLLAGAGKFDEAREEFVTALRLRPADAATHYNYAMLLGRMNKFDEAQVELEACLSADGKFTDAHLLLGDLLMAKQNVKEAAAHYEEALRVKPDAGRGHLGLGAALLAMGDRDGALLHLKKAASGTDAAVKGQASELLKRLEGR